MTLASKPDLPGMFQFTCTNGCGVCQPTLVGVNVEVEEDITTGEINRTWAPNLVSSCCHVEMDIWDPDNQEHYGRFVFDIDEGR